VQQDFFVAARRVASRRYQLDCILVTSPLYQPFVRAFGFFFDYGLSPPFAIMTFLGCLAVGYLGATAEVTGYHLQSYAIPVAPEWLSHQVPAWRTVKTPAIDIDPVLVINTNTVKSVAVSETGRTGSKVIPGVLTVPRAQVEVNEILCGTQIDPLLYAIDAFVPALDLGQEQRCQVSSEEKARVWRIINTLYVVLGWIVTALTILTVSGILRKQSDE
jgi:hypothetical protein